MAELLPEVKSSRQNLPKQVALPNSYNSFFSFPVSKTGYSGVVTYTRTEIVTPFKAEEGLTGLIQPRPPLSENERISPSGSYPPDVVNPDTNEMDYKELDGEGRAVVVDIGLFVLINVYCPNDGTGSKLREDFKMNYHRLLEARVDGLIKEGRQVMVVGDLNACAAVEDHCEGSLLVAKGLAEGLPGDEGFWGKEYRKWIRDWLIKGDGTGCLVDIVRKFWPDRRGMYTCEYVLHRVLSRLIFFIGWNTKISARESNYGTRIDFILITPGLIPWITAADIQPHIKGSDHCPVFVDLRDELANPDGSLTKLRDVLGIPSEDGPTNSVQPPRLAAKYWSEHQQRPLSTFFFKKSNVVSSPSPLFSLSTSQETQSSSDTPGLTDSSFRASKNIEEEESQVMGTKKRKIMVAKSPDLPAKKARGFSTRLTTKGTSKSKGKNPEQSTIASFFLQPQSQIASTSLSRPCPSSPPSSWDQRRESPKPVIRPPPIIDNHTISPAPSLSESHLSFPLKCLHKDSSDKNKDAWRSFLAPVQIPKCTVHKEPAKEYTVNKPGPNKGKRFFICSRYVYPCFFLEWRLFSACFFSRPVGPGYDKGRAERPREQVNPQFRCNFFKWSSDVRRTERNESIE